MPAEAGQSGTTVDLWSPLADLPRARQWQAGHLYAAGDAESHRRLPARHALRRAFARHRAAEWRCRGAGPGFAMV